jgi:hypothetical protein
MSEAKLPGYANRAVDVDRRQDEAERQCAALDEELTIIGTLRWPPLCEGMWFAAACHTEMALQLAALRAMESSVAQSVLGRSPTEAF